MSTIMIKMALLMLTYKLAILDSNIVSQSITDGDETVRTPARLNPTWIDFAGKFPSETPYTPSCLRVCIL